MLRRKGTKRVPRKAPAPPSLPREGTQVVEYRQVPCPLCGAAHGKRNGKDFWEYTNEFAPNKPFGIIQDVGKGRGRSFKVIRYFDPDDDPDGYFPLVRDRLLTVLHEWRLKGWITEEEVLKEYRVSDSFSRSAPRCPALLNSSLFFPNLRQN